MDSKHQKIISEIRASSIPVLIDFYGNWCEPCKRLSPIFEDLKNKYKSKIKFVKIDINDVPELAVDYSIRSLPSLILTYREREIMRIVSFQTKDALEKKIDEAISGLN